MESDVDKLVNSIEAGDSTAKAQAFELFRPRLKRMISAFLDPRLKARVDPSDVVQDAFMKANSKLPNYLEQRPIGFYPWLRAIVRDELIDVHRRHVAAKCRTVEREQVAQQLVTDASTFQLINVLVGKQASPSQCAADREFHESMDAAIKELSAEDRKILLMRFVEELPVSEIAEVLLISDAAAKSRIRRSLERLGNIVN